MSEAATVAPGEQSRLLRMAMRAYPRAWRDVHGDELTGVLLDVADSEGRASPRLVDLADAGAHGIRLRLAGWRNVLPVDVRRRATTIAIASGAALSTVLFLFAEWGPWLRDGTDYGPQVGPFLTLAPVVYVGWVVTFAAAIVAPRAARWCGASTLVLAIGLPTLANLTGWTPAPRYLLILLAMLAGLTLVGPVAADRRSRLQLLAIGVAMTAVGVVTFGLSTGFDADYIYRAQGVGRFPVVGDTLDLAVAGLAVALALSFTRHRGWSGGVALNIGPWLIAPSNLVVLDMLLFTDLWAGLLWACLTVVALGWVLHRSGVSLRRRAKA